MIPPWSSLTLQVGYPLAGREMLDGRLGDSGKFLIDVFVVDLE
jgi:hypothetical protein